MKKDELNNIPTTQREQYEYLGFDTRHLKEDEAENFATPFMDQWKTNVFATILGAVLFVVVYGSTAGAISDNSPFTVPCYVGVIAFQFLSIFYAMMMYPTLFGHKPMPLSNVNVSFLNGLLGGPIFAPLWNMALSKKKAGVSHIVFSCAMALLAASDVISFCRLMGL